MITQTLPSREPPARCLSRSSSRHLTRSVSSLIDAVTASMRRVRDITGSHHGSRSYVGERGEDGVGGVGEAETCSGKAGTSSAAGLPFLVALALLVHFFTSALPESFFVVFLMPRAFLGARPNTPLHLAVSFGMLIPVAWTQTEPKKCLFKNPKVKKNHFFF